MVNGVKPLFSVLLDPICNDDEGVRNSLGGAIKLDLFLILSVYCIYHRLIVLCQENSESS